MTLLSARFEGFDERDRRAPRHGRDLDRPVRPLGRRAARDGARSTRSPAGCPGALARGERGRWRASPRSSTAGSSTRTTRGRPSSAAGLFPTSSFPGDHGADRGAWRREQSRRSSGALRDREEPGRPPDGTGSRVPGGSTIDWIVTIVGAIAIVLAIKAWVVNPYRIPSSSMEPTLHCARPATGLRGRASPTACSPTASSTTSRDPTRRHRRLRHAAGGAASSAARAGRS